MKLSIIAVGTKMPSWVQQGYQEYAKRLPREMHPQMVELPIGNRSKGSSLARAIATEGEHMRAAIAGGSKVIALDVLGKKLSTEDLSRKMADWHMQGDKVAILIGGPDGLDKPCLQMASEKWSLSGLTLPHPLVRIVLIEQLYRAWTILQNHPYHK